MKLRVTVNGDTYEVDVDLLESEDHGAAPVASRSRPRSRPAPHRAPGGGASPATDPAPVATGNALKSPIPGTVLDVLVGPGDKVEADQNVVVLDAMKMNTNVASTQDGVIKEILVNEGDAVKMGQPLLTYE